MFSTPKKTLLSQLHRYLWLAFTRIIILGKHGTLVLDFSLPHFLVANVSAFQCYQCGADGICTSESDQGSLIECSSNVCGKLSLGE